MKAVALIPVVIYDNGGATFDRYTFVFVDPDVPDNFLVWGASENPSHPQGFGQFAGDFSRDQVEALALRENETVISALELPEGAYQYYLYLAQPEIHEEGT